MEIIKPIRGRQLNKTHPLNRGLVGCWLFNEGSGSRAFDLSGNENHGTLQEFASPPTDVSGWNAGRKGTSLGFNGSNSYVDCGSIGDIKTISFYIKLDTTTQKILETWGTAGDSVVYEGESYPTVKIGNQLWFQKNLNVGKRIDGVNNQTNNGIIEKYCYNNDPNNCTTYGGLYQWNEAMQYTTVEGAQGICPTGWHIPKDAEWYTLENGLKDEGATCDPNRNGVWDCATAGTKLKVGGTSGFEGKLGGYRGTGSSFYGLSSYGYFWSSSQGSSSYAWVRKLGSGDTTVSRHYGNKAYGFSVRCLKDNPDSGVEVSDGTIKANDFVSPSIYVDGKLSSTIDTNWHLVTITSDKAINGSKFNIGKIGDAYFKGLIDEVRIYNRALSRNEIMQLYLNPYCVF